MLLQYTTRLVMGTGMVVRSVTVAAVFTLPVQLSLLLLLLFTLSPKDGDCPSGGGGAEALLEVPSRSPLDAGVFAADAPASGAVFAASTARL